MSKPRRTTSAAVAAKTLRAELKLKYPNIKFSVKSRSFAGGDAVDYSWNLGPTTEEMDAIADKYEYGTFDSMTDSAGFKDPEANMAVTDEGIIELPTAKYVHGSRDYYMAGENNTSHNENHRNQTTLQFLLAKDLAKAQRIEWVGEYTGLYSNSTNHHDTAFNTAYRVLSATAFDTDAITEYQGIKKAWDAGIEFPEGVTFNPEKNDFEYNGESLHAYYEAYSEYVIVYDGKVSTPAKLLANLNSAIKNFHIKKQTDAAEALATEIHNTNVAKLKAIINSSAVSDAVKNIARTQLLGIDHKEREAAIDTITFKRFGLTEPIVIAAEFPRLNKNNTLDQYKEERERDIAEKKDIINRAQIEQVIIVDNIHFVLLSKTLMHNLNIVWQQIGGSSAKPELMQAELGYSPEEVDAMNTRWETGAITPAEKAAYRKHMVTHCTLVYNNDTKESFVVNTEAYAYARYVGFPVNETEVEKVMLHITENITPKENLLSDDEKVQAAIAEHNANATELEKINYKDPEDVAAELAQQTKTESLNKLAEVTKVKNDINNLTSRLELVKEMLTDATTKKEKVALKARIELIEEMLAEQNTGDHDLIWFRTPEPQIQYYDVKENAEYIAYITPERIQKLRDAGLSDVDVKAVFWGYQSLNPNIQADTEFAGGASGVMNYYEQYVDPHIEKVIKLVKAGKYEVGLKYPEVKDWKELFTKHGINTTPEIIEHKREKNGVLGYVDKIAVFTGNGFAVTTIMQTESYTDGKPSGSVTENYTEKDLAMDGRYWGVVSKDLDKLKSFIHDMLANPNNYIKDLDWLNNGLGGLGADSLTDLKVKYANGGSLDIDAGTTNALINHLWMELKTTADDISYKGDNQFEVVLNPDASIDGVTKALNDINTHELQIGNLYLGELLTNNGVSGDKQTPEGKHTLTVTAVLTKKKPFKKGGNLISFLTDKSGTKYWVEKRPDGLWSVFSQKGSEPKFDEFNKEDGLSAFNEKKDADYIAKGFVNNKHDFGTEPDNYNSGGDLSCGCAHSEEMAKGGELNDEWLWPGTKDRYEGFYWKDKYGENFEVGRKTGLSRPFGFDLAPEHGYYEFNGDDKLAFDFFNYVYSKKGFETGKTHKQRAIEGYHKFFNHETKLGKGGPVTPEINTLIGQPVLIDDKEQVIKTIEEISVPSERDLLNINGTSYDLGFLKIADLLKGEKVTVNNSWTKLQFPSLTKPEIASISRDEMWELLDKKYPNITDKKKSEQFSKDTYYANGIWTGAEDNYLDKAKKIPVGTHKGINPKFKDFLEKQGWTYETEGYGTVFLFPKNRKYAKGGPVEGKYNFDKIGYTPEEDYYINDKVIVRNEDAKKDIVTTIINKSSDNDLGTIYNTSDGGDYYFSQILGKVKELAKGGLVNSTEAIQLLQELINEDIIDEEHFFYEQAQAAITSNNNTDATALIEEMLNSDIIDKSSPHYKTAKSIIKKASKTPQNNSLDTYVAVHESKDGYWTIASKPTTKANAEAMLGGTPKNEVGKVVTLQEARDHKKVVGGEYLLKDGGTLKNIIKPYRYNFAVYVSVEGTPYGGKLVVGKESKGGNKIKPYLSHIEWDDNNVPDNAEEIEAYVNDNFEAIINTTETLAKGGSLKSIIGQQVLINGSAKPTITDITKGIKKHPDGDVEVIKIHSKLGSHYIYPEQTAEFLAGEELEFDDYTIQLIKHNNPKKLVDGGKVDQLTDGDKLLATEPVGIFIEKNDQNLPIEKTNIGKIPESRRERLSWKGCYYTILPNEEFYFRTSNNYDLSHFTLENGLDFKIDAGDPNAWIERNKIKLAKNIVKTKGAIPTKFLAKWGNWDKKAPNSYPESEQKVTIDFFTEDNGYTEEDINEIKSLTAGQYYEVSYGNHIVTALVPEKSKKAKGGQLDAHDLAPGDTLKHKTHKDVLVKVWNVAPRKKLIQVERDGLKHTQWIKTDNWDLHEKANSDDEMGKGGSMDEKCLEPTYKQVMQDKADGKTTEFKYATYEEIPQIFKDEDKVIGFGWNKETQKPKNYAVWLTDTEAKYYLYLEAKKKADKRQTINTPSKELPMEKGGAISSDQLLQGIEIEKEHTDLFNELKSRLESEGCKIPMTQAEFFTWIASDHIKEFPDYYEQLKKIEGKEQNGKTANSGKAPGRPRLTPPNSSLQEIFKKAKGQVTVDSTFVFSAARSKALKNRVSRLEAATGFKIKPEAITQTTYEAVNSSKFDTVRNLLKVITKLTSLNWISKKGTSFSANNVLFYKDGKWLIPTTMRKVKTFNTK